VSGDEFDIVARIRANLPSIEWEQPLAAERERLAADEIERLRAENQAFRDQFRDADEILAEWAGHTPTDPPPGWMHRTHPRPRST
jgi:hypothetical protein